MKLIIFTLAILQLGFFDLSAQINQKDACRKTSDLSSLEWELWGYRPEYWRMNFNFNDFSGNWAEFADIPVEVPGSVRNDLMHRIIKR